MSRYKYEFLDYTKYREVSGSGNIKTPKSPEKPKRRTVKTSGVKAALIIMFLIVAAALAVSAMFSALGKETGSHYKLNPSYQNYTSASTSQTDYHN